MLPLKIHRKCFSLKQKRLSFLLRSTENSLLCLYVAQDFVIENRNAYLLSRVNQITSCNSFACLLLQNTSMCTSSSPTIAVHNMSPK